jgi:RNA polymerase sigma-70 factor (ECF subfamily)
VFGRRRPPQDASPTGRFDLRAVVRDDVLFRRFYEETAPRVYAYLYSRTGSVTIAEDLTQEAFVEIVRNPSSFDGRSDPVPWTIGVARHRLLRHVRNERRDADRAREISAETTGTSMDSATSVAVRDSVEDALGRLTLEQRTALLLRFADDLSVRDVARAIGRSENATESLLRRARASFETAYRATE